MNALNTSKAHCAFWVSPEKPDLYDQYSNGSIDTWMKTRNSEYNFINGEKGDFNVLFPFIESKLQEVPKQEIKSLKLWKKSSLYNIISTSWATVTGALPVRWNRWPVRSCCTT